MRMRDEDIVAAARAVRAEFADLLDGEAAVSGRKLDALLARAEAGEPVADEILDMLASDSRFREEMRRRLPAEPDTSRGATGRVGSYAGLPGHAEPSAEVVYECQVCGYAYPVFEVGEPVPDACPRGHGPLIRGATP